MSTEFPNPLDLTDEQLRIARDTARWRAEGLLRKSKRAAPHEWSELAQASNRAVAEFLALDSELAARDAIRVATPLAIEDDADGYVWRSSWDEILMIVCALIGVVALVVLWAKTA